MSVAPAVILRLNLVAFQFFLDAINMFVTNHLKSIATPRFIFSFCINMNPGITFEWSHELQMIFIKCVGLNTFSVVNLDAEMNPSKCACLEGPAARGELNCGNYVQQRISGNSQFQKV